MVDFNRYKYFYLQDNSIESIAKNYGILLSWRNSPYSLFKVLIYKYLGLRLSYLCIQYHISANTITQIYILLAPLTLFLLCTTYTPLLIIALFLSFFKGSLDWADGPLARFTLSCSDRGKCLDEFGAIINYDCLIVGSCVFVSNMQNSSLFLFLSIIYFCSRQFLILNFMQKSSSNDLAIKSVPSKTLERFFPLLNLTLLRSIFINLLDSRARGNDTILFFILIALYYDQLLPIQISLIFIIFRSLLFAILILFPSMLKPKSI